MFSASCNQDKTVFLHRANRCPVALLNVFVSVYILKSSVVEGKMDSFAGIPLIALRRNSPYRTNHNILLAAHSDSGSPAPNYKMAYGIPSHHQINDTIIGSDQFSHHSNMMDQSAKIRRRLLPSVDLIIQPEQRWLEAVIVNSIPALQKSFLVLHYSFFTKMSQYFIM